MAFSHVFTKMALAASIVSMTALPSYFVDAKEAETPSGQSEPADQASASARISPDGRYVVFHSAASNLVPGDTNKWQDIFVYDRQAKTMERVSVTSDGKESDNYSLRPVISGNGRYVAFMSYATNLVSNDNNHQLDVFVHDRMKKTTEMASVSSKGEYGNSKSMNPVISTDGCCVAFVSFATNLIPDDVNGSPDILVRNLQQGTTEVVSLNSEGQQANNNSTNPAISADGRYVVFESPGRNLTPIDNKRSDEHEWNFTDVYLRDRKTGKTEIISVNMDNKPANNPSGSSSISADGRYVVFQSTATDLVPNYPTTKLEISGAGRNARRIDIFVRDRVATSTELVSVGLDGGSPGNHQSQAPKISADGRYVTFQSAASNLTESRMPGTTINIYQRDIQENKTRLVTVFNGPQETNVMSAHSAVTGDGGLVVFDTNYGHKGAELARESDVYVWNSESGEMELISTANTRISPSKQVSGK